MSGLGSRSRFTNSSLTDGATNRGFGLGGRLERRSLTGSFTKSNLTDGGANRDFGLGGRLERRSLTGSFTNSNLTDEEPIRILVRLSFKRGGRSGRFHCIFKCEQFARSLQRLNPVGLANQKPLNERKRRRNTAMVQALFLRFCDHFARILIFSTGWTNAFAVRKWIVIVVRTKCEHDYRDIHKNLYLFPSEFH